MISHPLVLYFNKPKEKLNGVPDHWLKGKQVVGQNKHYKDPPQKTHLLLHHVSNSDASGFSGGVSSFVGFLFLSNATHPTNERHSWLSVGSAIKHQVPGRPYPAWMVRHTAIGRVAPAKRLAGRHQGQYVDDQLRVFFVFQPREKGMF